MSSLTLHRRERNRWAATAGLVLVALTVGFLGLRPALATSGNASCTVVIDASTDTAEWQWSGVVMGAGVVGFVTDNYGNNVTVDTDGPDDVMGYGPSGTWASTAPVAAGATAFGIWVDRALGGGALDCTTIGGGDNGTGGESTTTTVEETTTTVAETTTTVAETTTTVEETTTTVAETTTTIEETTTTVAETTTTIEDTTTTVPGEANLSGTLDIDCETLELVLRVVNDGTATGDATLTVNGAGTVLTAGPGETVERRVAITAGSSVTASLAAADGAVLAQVSAETACQDNPGDLDASVVLDCSADEVRITVVNNGNQDETVAVSVNGVGVDVAVPAGSSTDHVEAIVTGASLQVSVTSAGGRVLLSEQWTDACAEPRPELSAVIVVDCDSAEAVITIRNSGTAAGVAGYDVNGTTSVVRVEPGTTEIVRLPIVGADPLDIAVWAGDVSLAREVRPVACDQPEPELGATAAIDCGAGTVIVTVINAGDVEGAVTVAINGLPQNVIVSAGQSIVITESITVGDAVPVLVISDGATILQQVLDANCAEHQPDLSASAAIDCNRGNVVVTIVNDGDRSGSVDITLDGSVSVVEVDAGATVLWSRPVAPGADVALRVSHQTEVLVSLDQSDVCRPAGPILTADIVLDCTNLSVVVTITNAGDQPGDATVTIGGQPTVVSVPAQSRVVRTAPVAEDASVTASVAVGGTTIRSVTLTADCRPNTTTAPGPTASIVRSCDRADAVIQIGNGGTADAQFQIMVNGVARSETLAPGQFRSISIPLVEDTRYEISVNAGTSSILASSTFVNDCANVLDQTSGRAVPSTPTASGYQTYNLAHTGVDAATLVAAGLALVTAGGLALSAAGLRRRRLAL